VKASDILGLNDLATKVVRVEEWDCDLTIRELTLDDGIRLFQMAKDFEDKFVMDSKDIAQVVAWGVIDPDTGERLFSDDDITALTQKNRKPLMFLYEQISSLSNEDAEKN